MNVSHYRDKNPPMEGPTTRPTFQHPVVSPTAIAEYLRSYNSLVSVFAIPHIGLKSPRQNRAKIAT